MKLEVPYGICPIAADRLLIADFGNNKSILTDINGCVYNCYKHHSTPKDFAYDPSNPSKVVVSLQKEIIMLDLETKAVIRKTDSKGFYPWKLQFLDRFKTYTGKRIIFLAILKKLTVLVVSVFHWSRERCITRIG